MRARMMRVSAERGTWFGTSRSSSPIGGTESSSRSSDDARQRGAVHRLQPLGVLDAGRQAARDVGGDVLAADGDGIDMDELASAKDGDRRRAAADVDAGAAELGLVVDEHRKPAGIGRRDHAPRPTDGSG